MMIKKFFMFLAANKALGAYFTAFEKDCERLCTNEADAFEHLFSTCPKNWICSAFYWDNTLHGCDYWARLNMLWCDFIHE